MDVTPFWQPPTWSNRRADRLPEDNCPTGCPIHVVVGSHRRKPVFLDPGLAAPLFAIVAGHTQTLGCCLMPDHLQWLAADASLMQQLVQSFKSYSTYVARTLGHRSDIWQPSHWHHVVREDEDLTEIAAHIVHEPVRKGLVDDYRQYPYQILKI